MTNPLDRATTEEPTTIDNPKPTPAGVKHDDGKRRYDLLPPHAMGALADVLTYGAKKYGPWNWKLIENPITRYHAAALRHVMSWAMGERLDPESGLPHLAHAAASLMFIVELEREAIDTAAPEAPEPWRRRAIGYLADYLREYPHEHDNPISMRDLLALLRGHL